MIMLTLTNTGQSQTFRIFVFYPSGLSNNLKSFVKLFFREIIWEDTSMGDKRCTVNFLIESKIKAEDESF